MGFVMVIFWNKKMLLVLVELNVSWILLIFLKEVLELRLVVWLLKLFIGMVVLVFCVCLLFL